MVSVVLGGLGYTTPTQSGTAAGLAPTFGGRRERTNKPEFRQARSKARKAIRRRNQA